MTDGPLQPARPPLAPALLTCLADPLCARAPLSSGSIITAAKLLYDAAVFNDDFAGAFPLLSHSQLAAAEIRFLQLLHWEPDASGKAHDT